MTRTLIEKLEAAEGPSRELDAEVAVALAGWEWHGGGEPREFQRFAGHWKKPGEEGYGTLEGQLCKCAESGNSEPPPYTSSLDAAVALVERLLPGAWRETSGPRAYLNIPKAVPNYWRATVQPWGPKNANTAGWGATEPLAILAALLKALEAREESE